jgi:hypothetical protein
MQTEAGEPDIQVDGVFGLAWGPFGDDPNIEYLSPMVNLLSRYPFPLQFYNLWLGP